MHQSQNSKNNIQAQQQRGSPPRTTLSSNILASLVETIARHPKFTRPEQDARFLRLHEQKVELGRFLSSLPLPGQLLSDYLTKFPVRSDQQLLIQTRALRVLGRLSNRQSARLEKRVQGEEFKAETRSLVSDKSITDYKILSTVLAAIRPLSVHNPSLTSFMNSLSNEVDRQLASGHGSSGLSNERGPESPPTPSFRQHLKLTTVDLCSGLPEANRSCAVKIYENLRAAVLESEDCLVKHNLGLVFKITGKYPNPKHQEATVSSATAGLLKAVRSFDPFRGIQFSTYAVTAMNSGVIKDHQERMRNERFLSYHACYGSAQTGDSELLSFLEQEPVPENDFLEFDLVVASLANLPENTRKVLNLRFGLGSEEPSTLRTIAKSLAISTTRVKQLETEGLEQLKAELNGPKSSET